MKLKNSWVIAVLDDSTITDVRLFIEIDIL